MSHHESLTNLNNFKQQIFTDEKGVKMTATQIASRYATLADKERFLRKQAEAETRNQQQAAEIARLRGLLDTKPAETKSKKAAA
jgi:hypothetical protein